MDWKNADCARSKDVGRLVAGGDVADWCWPRTVIFMQELLVDGKVILCDQGQVKTGTRSGATGERGRLEGAGVDMEPALSTRAASTLDSDWGDRPATQVPPTAMRRSSWSWLNSKRGGVRGVVRLATPLS